MRGIRCLKIVKCVEEHRSAEEKARVTANLDRAERLICREATKPTPEAIEHEYPMGIGRASTLTTATRLTSSEDSFVEEMGGRSTTVLTDGQVPETPDGLVQLFLSRPQDMLAWVVDVKKRAATPRHHSAASLPKNQSNSLWSEDAQGSIIMDIRDVY